MESSLSQAKAAVEKLEADETSVKKDLIEVQHKYEKYETVFKENHDKCRHWKKEVNVDSLFIYRCFNSCH